MFHAAHRPIVISDQLSIIWWRMVLAATRRLAQLKVRAGPVFGPLVPFLWLPGVALVVGFVIGWVIAAV